MEAGLEKSRVKIGSKMERLVLVWGKDNGNLVQDVGIGFLNSGLKNWRVGSPLSSLIVNIYLGQMDTLVIIITGKSYLSFLWISCSPVLDVLLEVS